MTLDEIPDPYRKQQWRLDFGYIAGYAAILFMTNGRPWDAGWFGMYAKPGKRKELVRLLLNAARHDAP